MASSVREVAASLLERCLGGFTNEFEHAAWLRKHMSEIDALPRAFRKAILAAHENASTPEVK